MKQQKTHLKGGGTLDRFIATTGKAAQWLVITMVLLQFAVVLARYLFDAGSVMAQEAILYMFGTMFMLALADALASDRHVRVDIFYHAQSQTMKRRIDAAGTLLFLLPLCLYMLWTSRDYVLNSWASLEGSREAAGLPGVYLFKTVIPVALIILILQGLAILLRCFRPLDGENSDG